MEDIILELKNVNKVFGNVNVINNINLKFKKGEFITFLGPSGCGKTTLLRMIAGFYEADKGDILLNGDKIDNLPPYKRNTPMVFQEYALFPHMNIYENIAFGLKIKKLPKDEIDKKVKEMLKLVALDGFERRQVESLSGGQQQRVAIARALVNEPKVLLLDEPLGALDLKLRKEMQMELKKIQKKLGITFIFVTHDQEEALTMSDKIIVMNKGKIQQMGTPQDIYNEPENSFVARFIGESNIFDGIMLEDYLVEFCEKKFKCVDKDFEKNENIEVVIRPEDVKMVEPEKGMLKGKVTSVLFKGVHYEIEVNENGRMWILHNTQSAQVGSELGLDIYPEDIHIMRKVSE